MGKEQTYFKPLIIACQFERFENRWRAVRRNYFHDEPTANHGKGSNLLQTINHCLSVERFENLWRAVRRNYFRDEPTANHGKGANLLQTVNHCLSVTNEGDLWKRFGICLGLQIWP
ncbi:hypothetical protein AVEN_81844-1 [Araneus ventricosus]|uniref:Uncharacterized protein n=1 Tax=Araneus ventricosus TaxID=182803 RepID=A0A4Y2IF74_ARAVE|nr:hypothetical protein AVEN_81844-1 [Araneus ventricosus]